MGRRQALRSAAIKRPAAWAVGLGQCGREGARRGATRETGQATLEAALTLPLAIFLVMGGLQVFLTVQARLMAQYAVARAAHVGSANFADCDRMSDAAVLALMPTFVSFLGAATPGANPEEKIANAFALRRTHHYGGTGNVGDGSPDYGYDGPIVWIFRESPLAKDVKAMKTGQDQDFDTPGRSTRLEIRMVYWFPLRVPFADWVMARAYLAQWGVEDYVAYNPLMPAGNANWKKNGGWSPEAAVKKEMKDRVNRKQFVMPISVSYTVRMMTPTDARHFKTQNCPPAP